MAQALTNRRQLAQLAYVLRAILDEISAAGGPSDDAQRHALDLVDAFVAGKKVPVGKLRAASAAVTAAIAGWGVHSPALMKALHWLPVATLLFMLDSGKDLSGQVMTHANYAVPNADWGARAKRIDAPLPLAIAHAAAFSDAPLAQRKKRVSARTAAIEAAALEQSRAALAPVTAALLDQLGAARDPKRMLKRAALKSRIARAGYPPNDAVLDFDETFGGLMISTAPGQDDWREENLYTLVGAAPCVNSGWSVYPRGGARGEELGLAPVAQGPQDDLYFLDPSGRAYYHETIGELNAEPFGKNGAELVTRLIIGNTLWFAADAGPTETLTIVQAEARVAERGLTLVSEDEISRWWIGPDDVVVIRREGVFARQLSPRRERRA